MIKSRFQNSKYIGNSQTKEIMLLFILVFSLISCNNVSKSKTTVESPIVEVPFKETNMIIDGFFVQSRESNDSKPYSISYIYKADLCNSSNNTFDKVITKFEIILELDNGNLLTKKEYGTGYFGEDILELISNRNWKPNQTQRIERLISVKIPIKYIDYPIKKVTVQYEFECDDQINDSQPIYTYNVDVTDKWHNAVIKVKNNEVDFYDSWDFAEKQN
ncbi:MAG: hypothetical protein WCG93_16205 [Paludibacter sp.]